MTPATQTGAAPASPAGATIAASDAEAQALAARTRLWKAIVIGLGLLILVALAAVAAGMVSRARELGKGPARAAGVAGAIESSSGRALNPAIRLALPEGSHIRSMTLSGDRLVVHYESARGAAIAVLDLATGKVESRVEIVPEPAR